MSSSGTSSLFVPHPELTKLTTGDIPNAAFVRVISRELYANAGSIPTTLGGGQHGHIGILMPVAEYATLAGPLAPPFVMPDRPAVPAYGTMNGANQAQARAVYERAIRDYETAVATRSLLKNQILEAVPKEYLESLRPIRLQPYSPCPTRRPRRRFRDSVSASHMGSTRPGRLVRWPRHGLLSLPQNFHPRHPTSPNLRNHQMVPRQSQNAHRLL